MITSCRYRNKKTLSFITPETMDLIFESPKIDTNERNRSIDMVLDLAEKKEVGSKKNVTCYQLQNHLRKACSGSGDEKYRARF